jgi:hypothetical protein
MQYTIVRAWEDAINANIAIVIDELSGRTEYIASIAKSAVVDKTNEEKIDLLIAKATQQRDIQQHVYTDIPVKKKIHVI